MKSSLQHLALELAHVESRHIKLVLIILSLAMFLLGAGAPENGGDISG